MKRTVLMLAGLGLAFSVQTALADWTTAKRLTWTDGGSFGPKIALDSGGHIHLAWYDNSPGNSEIYYKRSMDGGTTWTAAKRLTWSAGESRYLAISVDLSDQLLVVWTEESLGGSEIYGRRSTDGGETWTVRQRLTWIGITSEWPDIEVDPLGLIHLVWQDSTGEILYTKSPDGANWMLRKRLTWTTGSSKAPDMAIDSSGQLHVVWRDNTPAEFNYEVYYKKSTDAGTTWSTAKRLTWKENGSYHPDLAVDPDGNLHLVWYDENPLLYDIYYKKSTDSGASWTSAKRLTFALGWSAYPCLASDASGRLHLVWEETDGELYYRQSTNSGGTWTAIQRLTWTSGVSWEPALIADPSDNLHLVWYDDTPSNWEIYYKKFVR